MRVFVTGSTGVIGRRVVPLLATAGHEVTCAVRSGRQGAAASKLGARAAEVDLFDRARLVEAVAGHDAIINLATHMPRSFGRMFLPGAWRQNDRIRGVAVPNLADAARVAGVGRFIQESFAPIYEDRGDDWIDEGAPVQPAHYNRTTLDAERAVHRFSEAGGVGIVLRFAALYGPDSSQLGQMVAFVRRGWGLLPGRPSSFFSSVSHDDAATAVVTALSLPAGIYNVADDEPLRHRDFVDTIARAAGAAPPRLFPEWLTALGGSLAKTLARSLRISNKKLRDNGWSPRYPSARDGLPLAVAALP